MTQKSAKCLAADKIDAAENRLQQLLDEDTIRIRPSDREYFMAEWSRVMDDLYEAKATLMRNL